jgi:two-component system response regulator GlrR
MGHRASVRGTTIHAGTRAPAAEGLASGPTAECRLAPAPPQAGASTPCDIWAAMSVARTQVITTRTRDLLIRTLRLEVVTGPDRGKAIDIGEDEITVGTDPAGTLVLDDPTVSRLHFAIRPQPAGWLLRDLDSTNGTDVDGVTVIEAVVRPGHVISVGQTTLALSTSGAVSIQPLSEESSWGRALGKSAAMRRLFAILPKIASSDVPVLLEGETGTGKTMLADAIHKHGGRSGGPFVVVDCGAIAPGLIESELFGHDKGAFTGAHAPRTGAFELASGGTVFLDEIGELPLDLQPKLLRFLDEKAIRRVGGSETVALDVRVIAATNRDLRREVNRGTFRSDLFYRLNTIRLRVPPLRERREDVALLVAHFWGQIAPDDQPDPPAELLAELMRRDWPGNVRELRSAVERAVVLGDPGALDWSEENPPVAPVTDLELVDGQPFRVAKEQAVGRWERAYVRALIDRHGGNLSRAARAAKTDRNHLRELLQRHWPTDAGAADD